MGRRISVPRSESRSVPPESCEREREERGRDRSFIRCCLRETIGVGVVDW